MRFIALAILVMAFLWGGFAAPQKRPSTKLYGYSYKAELNLFSAVPPTAGWGLSLHPLPKSPGETPVEKGFHRDFYLFTRRSPQNLPYENYSQLLLKATQRS